MRAEARHLKASYIEQVQQQYHGDIITSPLSVAIVLYFCDLRKRDRDNRHKLSMDAMEGIVFENDVQIQKATVAKYIDRENPRIEIVISSL